MGCRCVKAAAYRDTTDKAATTVVRNNNNEKSETESPPQGPRKGSKVGSNINVIAGAEAAQDENQTEPRRKSSLPKPQSPRSEDAVATEAGRKHTLDPDTLLATKVISSDCTPDATKDDNSEVSGSRELNEVSSFESRRLIGPPKKRIKKISDTLSREGRVVIVGVNSPSLERSGDQSDGFLENNQMLVYDDAPQSRYDCNTKRLPPRPLRKHSSAVEEGPSNNHNASTKVNQSHFHSPRLESNRSSIPSRRSCAEMPSEHRNLDNLFASQEKYLWSSDGQSDPDLLAIYAQKMGYSPYGSYEKNPVPVSRRGGLFTSPYDGKPTGIAPEQSTPLYSASKEIDFLAQQFHRYQSLVRKQLEIVPECFRNTPQVSELILESSVIVGGSGQILMPPWVDADTDIKNNFWIDDWPAGIRALIQWHRSKLKERTRRVDSSTSSTLEYSAAQHKRSPGREASFTHLGGHQFFRTSDPLYTKDRAEAGSPPSRSIRSTALHRCSMDDSHDGSCGVLQVRQLPSAIQVEQPDSLTAKCCGTPRAADSIEDLPLRRFNATSAVHCSAKPLRTGSTNRRPRAPFAPVAHVASPAPLASSKDPVVFSENNVLICESALSNKKSSKTRGERPLHRRSANDEAAGSVATEHPSLVCRKNNIAVDLDTVQTSGADCALGIGTSLSADILLEKPLRSDDSCHVFCNGWSLDDGRWTDADGFISLSQKQRNKFFAWTRISDMEPDKWDASCVFRKEGPRSSTIRQGFVGDCSFLSSLAVLAEYEQAHGVPVLSGILYPQAVTKGPDGRKRLFPLLNPKGMYACRLFFNGVPRKVLLDDYIPIRKDGKLLSAHTSNSGEFWVTLLEKGFVKLMGGSYFMQGSNPGADLYHLTGWIPETIPFRMDVHTGTPESHRPIVTGRRNSEVVADPKWDKVWHQLYKGLVSGSCVACLGTSDIYDAAPSGLDYPEGVSQSSGIVARHAYSILRIADIPEGRLLYVKNPWCCIRWRGHLSPWDHVGWTPDLQRRLNYVRAEHELNDDGCFWISWTDIIQWFSHLYVCWNNSSFSIAQEVHSKWDRTAHLERSLLLDDAHFVAFNPQFHLSVIDTCQRGITSIWVLLSRHVRERKRDLAQKYLAIHLHEGQQRVLCPPPAARQGVYSNGECTLVKLQVDLSAPFTQPAVSDYGTQEPHETDPNDSASRKRSLLPAERQNEVLKCRNFVLVISQYSQKDEFNFTVKAFSQSAITLKPLPPLFPETGDWCTAYRKGEWTLACAGGCSNDLWEYFRNPQTRLRLNRSGRVIIFLESISEHSVNLRIFKHVTATPRLLRSGRVLSSGSYRSGCCVIEAFLERGDYTLVASTFRRGETGKFQICVNAGNLTGPPLSDRDLSEVSFPYDKLSGSEISLWPLPQPFAIPPGEEIFYHKRIESSSRKNRLRYFGEMLRLNISRAANIAVRLAVANTYPDGLVPSMTLLRGPPELSDRLFDDAVETLTQSMASWRQGQGGNIFNGWTTVIKSDLEGGSSHGHRQISSAALDLYRKQGIGAISHVHLMPKKRSSDSPEETFLLIISPASLSLARGKTAAVSASLPAPAALIHPGQPGCPFDTFQTRGDLVLHVISDVPFEVASVL